jgi:hypothetical protein
MKRKMVQVEQVWMNGEELAEALDLSPGRVSQLATLGVFEREKDGFELGFSLRNYAKYILNPSVYSDRHERW